VTVAIGSNPSLGASSLPSQSKLLNDPDPQRRVKLDQMDWGDGGLTAPTTPEKRVAVIDRSKVDPETLKAAQGMETMFLDYMMKVMRQTIPKSEMDMESPATDIYRGMMDSEYAQRAAKAGGIGLADQIIAYLDQQRYTLPKRSMGPVGPTGSEAHETGNQIGNKLGGFHEGDPTKHSGSNGL
jgi:flagellar protein FlgJ